MKSSSLLHKSFHHVPFTSLALEPCEIIQKGLRSVIFWQNKPCHFNEHEKFVILLDFSMLSVQLAVFRINVQKIWIKPRYYRVENFMRGPAVACQTLKYCEIPLTKQQNARPFHAKWVAFEKNVSLIVTDLNPTITCRSKIEVRSPDWNSRHACGHI